jgi:two-component system OmpR family response regulator
MGRRIAIVEDEPAIRDNYADALRRHGYDVAAYATRDAALAAFRTRLPDLALIDIGLGDDPDAGFALTRELRARAPALPIIFLTARESEFDIVAGLRAGADDYITKPVDREEFEARLQVAARIVGLQQRLTDRVKELEQALTRVRQLQGLLPICAYCKRIRDDQNYWNQVETYLAEHTDVQFSHGICPSCFDRVMQDTSGEIR